METQSGEVFISYSYDSAEHKMWVYSLYICLRQKGVNATLDKAKFTLGKPTAMDMEEALIRADRVLCICTDSYIQRVNEGIGGAGYEGCIIKNELVKRSSTHKFIPVIRNVIGPVKAPNCLDGRYRVDLSDGEQYEGEFETLLRHLHNATDPPPLGTSPFVSPSPLSHELPGKALTLLKEASKETSGIIRSNKGKNGLFTTNGITFRAKSARDRIEWEDAIDRACKASLLEPGEQGFQITAQGYQVADSINWVRRLTLWSSSPIVREDIFGRMFKSGEVPGLLIFSLFVFIVISWGPGLRLDNLGLAVLPSGILDVLNLALCDDFPLGGILTFVALLLTGWGVPGFSIDSYWYLVIESIVIGLVGALFVYAIDELRIFPGDEPW